MSNIRSGIERLPKGSKIKKWRVENCNSCELGNKTECEFILSCMRAEKLETLRWISEHLLNIRYRD